MAKANRMERRRQRHARVRRKIQGTSARPRLNVYRSTNHIYAQIIDDEAGHTVASASTLDKGVRAQLSEADGKREEAKTVGKALAERAREQGIESVVFDRGGYAYHGRVAALAEGSREGGLVF